MHKKQGTAVPAGSSAVIARSRLRRLLVLLPLLMFGVSGCGTGAVYDRMDWLVSWYVNGLVSLDDDQERELRSTVHRTMAWHRQTQLPRYVQMLNEMAEEADRPASASELEARYQQISGFLDDSSRHIIPLAAPLLVSLSSEQQDELGENLEEGNQDLWKDYAGETPEERHAQRRKSAVRMLQRFVGKLSDDQRELVDRRLAGMHDVSGEWVERRRTWQQHLLGLTRNPGPLPEFVAALEDMALNPNQFDSQRYRQQVEANRQVIMAMLAEISASLSSRQQQHLRAKFLDLAGDLERISEAS